MLQNTAQSYGGIAKAFHWVMALLVVVMLFVGYFMGDWGVNEIFNLHKLTGLLILSLTVLRIMWVLNNVRPSLPATIHKWERILSRSVQGVMYVALLTMTLSGWAMVTAFGYFPHIGSLVIPMPGIPIDQNLASVFLQIHVTTAVVLITLICLHVLGALKHHFFDKDDVLKKMLPSCCKIK